MGTIETGRRLPARGRRNGAATRFLTGESGEPVDVAVEIVANTPDLVVRHNLESISDFEPIDFYLPLLLLFAIFVLQFFVSEVVVLGLQLALLRDLLSRVSRRPSGKKAAGMVRPYGKFGWGWALSAYAVSAPAIFGVAWLNRYLYRLAVPSFAASGMFAGGSALDPGLLMFGLVALASLFFTTVVLAPVTEEIWFRGIGLAGFMKKGGGPVRAVLWTSLIFGLLHGPSRFMFTAVFGLFLGLVRFRTGSTYCCIVVHALHNFLVIAHAFYGLFV